MSKKQWKNVTENLTCQFSTKSTWSQEEQDVPTVDVSEIRSVLPTKTSATRQISDLENVSQNGPFLLNFSNIPFDADENAIRNFFQAFDVVNVIKSEHKRGTGIIEFRDFNSLSGAIGLAEKHLNNRPIRLTIGHKEDLIRIQSGGNQQRGRYQNQQRSIASTLSEDSDNWRTKKAQPVSQISTDNFKGEKPNWREKPTSRNEEKVLSSDNADNWRKAPIREVKCGNFNRRNQPMHETTKQSAVSERSEARESLATETKKVSIFGEAKPVDTQTKYLEIEQKIELSKKQTGDEPLKNEPISNAWGNKKHTNSPISSSVPPATEKKSDKQEWQRGKKASIVSKSSGGSQRESTAKTEQSNASVEPPKLVDPPKPAEPQPAPPPFNIWEERMKSKALSGQNTCDRNNSASKGSVETSNAQQTPVSSESTAQLSTVYQNIPGNNIQSSPVIESKANPKPPVIISANGPFLDPKSRTPHHSMSDSSSNKAPTAVPINKLSSSSDTCKETDFRSVSSKPFSSPSEQHQSKQNTPLNTCCKQSSWAKGPPKGLIEKTEINQ